MSMRDVSHMDEKLFRQEALRTLSSPEQLDVLMTVTSPTTWIALLAMGVLLSAAIGWAVLGWVPTRIQGTGMLIRTGGILEVESVAAGQIVEVMVEVGDLVERDQPVVKIAQQELTIELEKKIGELKEMKERHKALSEFGHEKVK